MNKFYKITPIILSGGSGKRLWPISKHSFPKQFLNLPFGSKLSLFQKTILRLQNKLFNEPIIICSAEHKFFVKDQLENINANFKEIIVEPLSRNTAPAICIASIRVYEEDSNSMIMVFPSDHFISDEKLFTKKLSEFIMQKNDNNTLFGLEPREPKTSYGYIKVKKTKGKKTQSVEAFIEKPELKIAKQMLKEKKYLWNSGIFFLNVQKTLDQFKKHSASTLNSCYNALKKSKKEKKFCYLDEKKFSECNNISFDYAILEKVKDLDVYPLDLIWSDLGSWNSIWEIEKKDKFNNVLIGKPKVKNVNNSLIITDKKLNILNNLSDIIIISIDGSLLVSSKSDVDSIKHEINDFNTEEYILGEIEFRPWGSFKVIEKNDKYVVKKLIIKPKRKLSLQKHMHRSEHWTIVKGEANITLEKNQITLKKNESIFIPKESIHCIENRLDEDLEIIETQVGEILLESDIIRYEDPYNR